MINYVNILLAVLLVCTIFEFILARYPNARKQLFQLAFGFTVVWVAIKYYLGPDIFFYVPFYENIQSPREILTGHYTGRYEIGFGLFCSLCKYIGLSFWGMTCAISIIYFIPLYKIISGIKGYNTFALFVLCVLDYNLMLYELRQSLAVSAIMISYLCFQTKDNLPGLIIAVMAIFMHKSAIFVILIASVIIALRNTPLKARAYFLLTITFLLLMTIPLSDLINENFIENIPIDDKTKDSIILHLKLGSIKQLIAPIYLIAIACIAYYGNFSKENMKWNWCIWCCLALIVILFQFWFFLNRLRSYVLPFAIPYIFNTCLTSQKNAMLRQSATVVYILYSCVIINSLFSTKISETQIVTTVFSRLHTDEKNIRDAQMKKAKHFWYCEYPEQFKEENAND